ncbi:MAG: SpoVR family protein [Chloroflexi bacterium]|nr:SpoVR family protein [Chloroflexota bacterium]
MSEIWDISKRLGLDPFPTHFELVPAAIMYEFGAYGLPGRFSHWTRGKAYHQLKTRYDYGLSKIYELVVNTNPCYGFLMESNSLLQNKLVVAHVLAHCDFFKNNIYFRHTSRQMIETASVSAERIRGYEFRHGSLEVERFLDAVLSIQEHIDPNVFTRRKSAEEHKQRPNKRPESPYDDLFYEDRKQEPKPEKPQKTPPEPEKDLLLFIMEYSPVLTEWQRDVVSIVRSESLYFLPQMQTKIMNEGWASLWHARILREMDLSQEEYVEFAALNAGVLAPAKRSINPYYVGIKMFEDIQKRWDKPTDEEREKFGRRGDEGLAKIFEVRELESDVSFLRNYLTKELVDDLDLYLYRLEGDKWVIVEKNWEKVRDTIVKSMTNYGFPVIVVEDGDYRGNRELYLKHLFEEEELDMRWAERTMPCVQRLWGRPVHLETIIDEELVILSCDGDKVTTAKI